GAATFGLAVAPLRRPRLLPRRGGGEAHHSLRRAPAGRGDPGGGGHATARRRHRDGLTAGPSRCFARGGPRRRAGEPAFPGRVPAPRNQERVNGDQHILREPAHPPSSVRRATGKFDNTASTGSAGRPSWLETATTSPVRTLR